MWCYELIIFVADDQMCIDYLSTSLQITKAHRPQDRSTAAYDNCCTVLPVVLSAAAEFNNSDTQLIVTDDVFEQSEIKSYWPQTIAYAFKRRPQLLLWRSHQFLVLGFFILSYSTFRCGHAFKVAEHVQTAN